MKASTSALAFDPVDFALLSSFAGDQSKKELQQSIVLQNQWKQSNLIEEGLRARLLSKDFSIEILNALYDSPIALEVVNVINHLLDSSDVDSISSLTLDEKIALLKKIASSKFKHNKALLNQILHMSALHENRAILAFAIAEINLFIPEKNYSAIHLVKKLHEVPVAQIHELVSEQLIPALTTSETAGEKLWILLENAVDSGRFQAIKNVLVDFIKDEACIFNIDSEILVILPKLAMKELLDLYAVIQGQVLQSLENKKALVKRGFSPIGDYGLDLDGYNNGYNWVSISAKIRKINELQRDLQLGQLTDLEQPRQKFLLEAIAALFNEKLHGYLKSIRENATDGALAHLKIFLPYLSAQTVVACQDDLFGLVKNLGSDQTFEFLKKLLFFMKGDALIACRKNMLKAIAQLASSLLVKLNNFIKENENHSNGLFEQYADSVEKMLSERCLPSFTANEDQVLEILEYLTLKSKYSLFDSSQFLNLLKSMLSTLTESTALQCKRHIINLIQRNIMDRSDIQPTIWLIDLCTFITDDTFSFKSNLSQIFGEEINSMRDQAFEADKELSKAIGAQVQIGRLQARVQSLQHADVHTIIEILKEILPQLSVEQFTQHQENILKSMNKLNEKEEAQLNLFLEDHVFVVVREALVEAMKFSASSQRGGISVTKQEIIRTVEEEADAMMEEVKLPVQIFSA